LPTIKKYSASNNLLLEKSGMSEKLRKSGIDIIGDIPWGTHFCQFYQTKEDLMEILIPYLRAGLENNEFCLWITSQALEEEVKDVLGRFIPDFDLFLERKQIEIIPCTQGYVKEAFFDSGKVTNYWVKKLDQALTSGYEGLRLTGNPIGWLESKDWGHLADHNKNGSANLANPQVISLCPYFLDICSVADLIEMVFNYQFALIRKDGKWKLIENSGRRDLKIINTEETIRQSEHLRRLEQENLLYLKGKILKPEFSEIVDVQAVQLLMDDFYKLAHIPIGIIDLKGNILVGVEWQEICTKFHRAHPQTCKHCIESDIKLSSGVSAGEFKIYKCKNNMWDIATPIIAGDQHIGNIFLGQFFFEDEPLDYEFFRSQAKRYGFNEEEYIAALKKVPRLSKEAVNIAMAFFMKLAHMLSQLSYSSIKLAYSLAERDALVSAMRESEDRERTRSEELEAVLDTVPAAVWKAHDPAALLITGNRLFYEWLRISESTNMSKSVPKGEKLTFRLFKDELEIPIANMLLRISAAGKELNDYEFGIKSADGEMRYLLGNARPLHDENGNPRGSVSAFIDITARKKAEEALKEAYDSLEEKIKERTLELEEAYKTLEENERRLSEAQKMAHIGIWDWDFVNDEMYWSEGTYHIFGLVSQESSESFNELLSRTHPDDREYVNEAVKIALKGKPFSIDHRIILSEGEVRIVHAQGKVIFDDENIPIRMRGTIQDITENKKAEERIQILADAVESSDDAIITESLDGIITSWNKGAEQIYGYSAEEILETNASVLEPSNLKGEIKRLIEKVKQREKIQRFRTFRLKKDGTVINVSVTLSPIFDSSGKFEAVSCIARDITERIKAEEALAKIENARKKEIHHRIKNNLQVISSLLDLQAEKFSFNRIAPTKEILEAFRESQNRVISMSLIHEELNKGEGNDTLDFSAYLRKLSENLFRTYSLNSKHIRLCMDLEENAFFNMDTAVPLGIIVNELVSNSLKHAFRNKHGGKIKIRLCRENKNIERNESYFSLRISDDGKGIPENIELENAESLGLQLVSTLVDQLDGKIEIKRELGTEIGITFKVPE
jgi:PAS domain S-box-containing protein